MLAHVQAGSRDLERAAEALATRLPEQLGVFARLAYNYRWSWDPDGPDVFRDIDPDRWERVAENPVKLLQEARRAAADRRRRTTRRCSRARSALEERVQRRPQPPDPRRPRHRRPPDRVLLRGVRLPRLVPDLLAAASARSPATSSRRRPTAPGRWPRSACSTATATSASASTASGWQHEYWVDTDPDRLPAALVTGDDGAPITVSVHGRRRSRSSRRSGAPTSAACRSSCSTPTGRRTPRPPAGSPRASTSATRTRASPSTCCSASAASARSRRWGSSRASCTSTRATRRSCRSSSPGASTAATARSSAALEIAQKRTVFTTHTPVPAGNDTYPAHQVEGVLAHIAGTLGVDPAEIISLGRTNPDEEAEPFGVTQFALRTSRAANGVASRHGEVAREMWQAMWPDTRRRRRPDHPRHQRRPHPDLARQADLGAAQPPPRRGLAGPRDRPRDLGAGRRHPRQGDLGRPHAAARRADRVRPPSRGGRPARARRTARRYAEAAARVRPGRADGRLRPPPGDLQAAEPAPAGRRARDARRRRRPPGAGAAGRQGAPARRRRQAARAGAVHA